MLSSKPAVRGHGLADSKLPSGATMCNQTIFGSIGYATGAALRAFKAMRESSGGKYKRGILVTGEGSLHLTVQTFADLLKLELNPIVFVMNNDGYTVERLIHGKEAYVPTYLPFALRTRMLIPSMQILQQAPQMGLLAPRTRFWSFSSFEIPRFHRDPAATRRTAGE